MISTSLSHLGEALKKEVALVFFRSLIGLFRAALAGTFPAWPEEGAVGNWGRTEGGPAWGVLPVCSRGPLGSTNQYSSPFSMVPLSGVSVTSHPPRSEDIKWKISEENNS